MSDARSAIKSAKSLQLPTVFTAGDVNRAGKIGFLKNNCIDWNINTTHPAIKKPNNTEKICFSDFITSAVTIARIAASAAKLKVS